MASKLIAELKGKFEVNEEVNLFFDFFRIGVDKYCKQ